MLWWILIAAVFILVALTVLIYICYRMTFYQPRDKSVKDGEEISLPDGEIYEPFYPLMTKWSREARQLKTDQFTITSFDGLRLCATYYEYAPNAPIELMFHGYRGNAERDLSGGVQRCFSLKRSCLVVDQRCSGGSEGHTITFGVREHRDCLSWVEFMCEHFGPKVRIILTGISMGAATVLMAAGKRLPPNVIGVLADCGYSSQKVIIKKVIRDMGLPPELCYPFVKLSARLFGGFDLEETTPLEAMKTCNVPVIFYHGEADAFVPCEMSRQLYAACKTRKKLVTVPGAGHGLSYPMEQERYLKALKEFFSVEG